MVDTTRLCSPVTEAATQIYAVGDIHGRLDLLEKMEDLIQADLKEYQPSFPLICYLGDFIDRGPSSAQILDRLSATFADGVPRVFIKGNHEDRMLDFLDQPANFGPSWLQFGGREALSSYGIQPPSYISETTWFTLRDQLRAALPFRHTRFLKSLQLGLRWREFLFVHAGIDPRICVTEQYCHDLMWIREPFLSSDHDYGFTVVHGHSVTDEPVVRFNRIGIDTGAYLTGRLTCLIASDQSPRFIQTVD